MTEKLIQRMTRGARPLLWDGGVGTALIARGLELSRELPEDWLLTRPDEVEAVHSEFAAAGADVVQTNSFGLLRKMLSPDATTARCAELAKKSVELALSATTKSTRESEPALVVASLGPIATPELFTDASYFDRLSSATEQLTTWFAEAGAHGLHLETACHAAELSAMMTGVRAASTRLPLLVSITVSAGQSGFETPLGVPLARMVEAALRMPPDVLGLNCSLHARRMRKAVETLRELVGSGLPILVQPQVDQPAPDCKRPAAPETPEKFATELLTLLDDGADAVGGCCGARAFHVAAARAALDGSF